MIIAHRSAGASPASGGVAGEAPAFPGPPTPRVPRGNSGGYGYNGYDGSAGYNGYNGYGGYDGYNGYDRGRWEHHDHDNAAPLIAAGLVGLVLVAALASSHNHAQTGNAYANGYNDPNGNYPDVCTQQRQSWNSHAGRYVTRSYRVAC